MPDDYAKRYLVAASSESTYGSDAFGGADPSSWLAVIESDSPPLSDEYERVPEGSMPLTHDTQLADHYGDRLEVSMEMPIKSETSAIDAAPPHDALLKAANLKEAKRDPDGTASSGDEYIEYFPYTGDGMTNVPSATLACYLFNSDYSQHAKWLAKGLRHNLTWSFPGPGELCTVSLDGGLALFSQKPTPSTASSLQPSAYSGQESNFILKGGTFKYDGTAYPLASYELSTGWNVSRDNDGTQSQGTLKKVSLDRGAESPPNGSFSLKARESVVKDLIDDIKAGNGKKATVELTAEGGTAVIYHELPNVQINDGGLSLGSDPSYEVPFFCAGTYNSGGATQLTSGHNSFFIQHGESTSDFGNRA
ncbi:MAG: hypothetical protein ABEN55_16245 [Bradymonadaceae bacterium]